MIKGRDMEDLQADRDQWRELARLEAERAAALETETARLKAVIRALQKGLSDNPPMTNQARHRPVVLGGAAKETTA